MTATTAIAILELAAMESAAVRDATDSVVANPYTEPDAFASEARAATLLLPGPLRGALAEIQIHEGAIALLIRGLPMPVHLPETPCVRFDLLTSQVPLGTERVLGVLGLALGEIFAYREWDRGYVVQNRYPIASHAEVQSASGSAELVLHTEASFAVVSPDHLVLLSLRPDPLGVARTSVCDVALALSRMSARTRARLELPEFAFKTDHGQYTVRGHPTTRPRPIVGQGGRFEYSQSLIGCTLAASRALDEIAAAFDACATHVLLEPGDAFVIDNRRAVHGRTAFTPAYNGTDRWLQRVLLRHHLDGGQHVVADSRVANYPSDYRRTLAFPR